MKKVLSWPVFYELSEIYTAPLNMIWFMFATAIAYQQYHLINLINVLLCFACVFLFDLAVNIADNYFDYLHGKDQHFLNKTNPIGRLKLSLPAVRNLVIISYLISIIPGLILVYRTGWQILVLGMVGYFVGIFYTAGPKPINATPICEAVVALFISTFINIVGVYVNIYDTYQINWQLIGIIVLRVLPLTLIMYACQLGNNLCDLEEDLANGRKTLVSYIGVKDALKLDKAIVITAMLLPILLVIVRVMPWPIVFSSILLPLLMPQFNRFFTKPDKQTTYLLLVKNGSIFLVGYILLYTILVFL